MTRLHDEIAALRDSREGFIGACEAFVKGVRDDVSAMRADFRSAHAEMAQEARTGRQAFASHVRETVADLRQTVAGLRKESASDVIGAHEALFGRSRVTRGPKEGKAKPARRSSRRPG
jgi:methyl-accepting chemotaxis protein